MNSKDLLILGAVGVVAYLVVQREQVPTVVAPAPTPAPVQTAQPAQQAPTLGQQVSGVVSSLSGLFSQGKDLWGSVSSLFK